MNETHLEDRAKIWYDKGSDYGRKNHREVAIKCFEKCIELNKNHQKAYFKLGLMGENTMENYKKSADLGYSRAQYNYGIMLLRKPDTAEEGVSYLQRAANAGHPKAKQIMEKTKVTPVHKDEIFSPYTPMKYNRAKSPTAGKRSQGEWQSPTTRETSPAKKKDYVTEKTRYQHVEPRVYDKTEKQNLKSKTMKLLNKAEDFLQSPPPKHSPISPPTLSEDEEPDTSLFLDLDKPEAPHSPSKSIAQSPYKYNREVESTPSRRTLRDLEGTGRPERSSKSPGRTRSRSPLTSKNMQKNEDVQFSKLDMNKRKGVAAHEISNSTYKYGKTPTSHSTKKDDEDKWQYPDSTSIENDFDHSAVYTSPHSARNSQRKRDSLSPHRIRSPRLVSPPHSARKPHIPRGGTPTRSSKARAEQAAKKLKPKNKRFSSPYAKGDGPNLNQAPRYLQTGPPVPAILPSHHQQNFVASHPDVITDSPPKHHHHNKSPKHSRRKKTPENYRSPSQRFLDRQKEMTVHIEKIQDQMKEEAKRQAQKEEERKRHAIKTAERTKRTPPTDSNEDSALSETTKQLVRHLQEEFVRESEHAKETNPLVDFEETPRARQGTTSSPPTPPLHRGSYSPESMEDNEEELDIQDFNSTPTPQNNRLQPSPTPVKPSPSPMKKQKKHSPRVKVSERLYSSPIKLINTYFKPKQAMVPQKKKGRKIPSSSNMNASSTPSNKNVNEAQLSSPRRSPNKSSPRRQIKKSSPGRTHLPRGAIVEAGSMIHEQLIRSRGSPTKVDESKAVMASSRRAAIEEVPPIEHIPAETFMQMHPPKVMDEKENDEETKSIHPIGRRAPNRNHELRHHSKVRLNKDSSWLKMYKNMSGYNDMMKSYNARVKRRNSNRSKWAEF